MAEIPQINETSFQADVLKSTLPVLVDFSAVWCGPCKMLEPVITQLSKEWDGKVKFGRLDVDESSAIAVQYGIFSVPTLILFVNGEPVQRLSGYQPKDRLIAKFGAYIQA